MKVRRIAQLATVLLVAVPSAGLAEGWQLSERQGTIGLRLTYSVQQSPTYVFECGDEGVTVTQIGVTNLTDLRTNTKVGDTPVSQMLPGASMMALFTGRDGPDMIPARSVPNAARGWDMTILLHNSDKHLRGLAKAEFISLFTTGETRMVQMGADDRKLASEFLKRCRSGR